jgi:hypothetical protein
MSKAIQFLNRLPNTIQEQQYSSLPSTYEQLLHKVENQKIKEARQLQIISSSESGVINA